MSKETVIPLGTSTSDGNVSLELEDGVLIVTLRLPTTEKRLQYSPSTLVGRLLEGFKRLLLDEEGQ